MRNIFAFIQLIIIFIPDQYSLKSSLLAKTNEDQESNLKDEANGLSNPIKTKRFTKDGRVCASSFIHQGEMLVNCAKTLTPDGLKKNKEWCYVENPERGFRTWDYCLPTIDYEYIREFNQNIMKKISKSLKELTQKISNNLSPAENILAQLKSLKLSQTELIKKIHIFIKNLGNITFKLKNLNLKKESLINQEESIKNLKFNIEKRIDPDNYQVEESETGNIVQNKKKSYDCKGMMLYEDADEGDGLLGKYYNNEYWDGEHVEVSQSEIDFNWGGTNPLTKINSKNFSVEWLGYLKVPISGQYKFTIEADDGYELTIRDEVVIRNKLDLDLDDDYNPLLNIGTSISSDETSFESLPIILESESRIKLQVKYYHSIHNDLLEKREVYIRLYWANDDFEKEIIPKKYLFIKDYIPEFKIFTDINSNFAVGKLLENDSAFIDNDNYYLQDIPKQFIGSTALKFVHLFKENEIRFEINLPCVVNIGILFDCPNPLDERFEKNKSNSNSKSDTDVELKLVRIEKNKNLPSMTYLRGVKSGSFSLYSHSFEAGEVKIPLTFDEKNQDGISLVLFFSFDRNMKNKLECIGDEIDISKSSGDYFKQCSASSEIEGMDCMAGFSGDFLDEEGSIWASFNEGPGAWIEIEFREVFEIRKFRFKNRKNLYGRNKVLELNFTNNRKRLIDIKSSDDLLEFPIIPVKSNRVKITIKEVYGEVNNGGAFGFTGKKCIMN